MKMAHEKDQLAEVEEHELEIGLKTIDTQLTQTKQLQNAQQNLKEAYKKIGRMYETQRNLLEQIDGLRDNENIDKYLSEIASIKQEKNIIESELDALQKDNEAIFDEKEKLANDIQMMEQSNEQLSNEIDKIKNVLMHRDDELKKLTENFNAKDRHLVLIRKIALKYKCSLYDLRQKHDELVAEKAAKSLNQQAAELCHTNTSTQTDVSPNHISNELNDLIADKQQQNDSLRTEIETLSKRLMVLDAEHTSTLNTIQTLIDEKEKITFELRENKKQSEFHMKNSIDKDKKNTEAIVRLTRKNGALESHIYQLRCQLANVSSEKSTTKVNEKSPLDARFTTNAKPIAENLVHPPQLKSVAANRTSGSNPSTGRNRVPNVRKRAMEMDRPPKKSKPTKMAAPKSESFKWCCNNCSESFNQRQLIKAHLQHAHHYAPNRLIYQYECKICQYPNDSVSDIKSHMSTAHAETDLKNHVKCNYKRIPI